MDTPYKASDKAQLILQQEHVDPKLCPKNVKEVFRYRIKLTKTGTLRYFSHLDWQNTFFKSISRSNLKVAFSYGFNPTMKISMGIALPLFCESKTELVDIELWEDVTADYVKMNCQKFYQKSHKFLMFIKLINQLHLLIIQLVGLNMKLKYLTKHFTVLTILCIIQKEF